MEANNDNREFPAASAWGQPGANPATDWGTPPPPHSGHTVPVSGPPRTGRRSGLWILLLVLGGMAVLGGLLLLIIIAAVGSLGVSMGGLAGFQQYTVEEGKGRDRILKIDVTGVIASSEGSAPHVINQLQNLVKKNDPPNVKAVILHVDSPGGVVTTCDVIDSLIQKLKTRGIRIVSFYDSLAASGGYYVSARSDHIVARPTCMTGSIGVITMTVNARDLLENKLGLDAQAITSVPFKDVPSLLRPMKEEERAYMQKMINDMHSRFVGIVKEGRGLTAEQVAAFADGRVFLSKDALDLKMIDEIGHWDAAVAAARKMIGSNAPVIGFKRIPSPLEQLMRSQHQSVIPEELKLKLKVVSRGQACYLWMP